MKKIILVLLSIIWLVAITPLFGIFPLLLELHIPIPREIHFIGVALLAQIFSFFITLPQYYSGHEGAPLTTLGLLTMLVIVFSVAGLSINFLWQTWKNQKQKTIYTLGTQKNN